MLGFKIAWGGPSEEVASAAARTTLIDLGHSVRHARSAILSGNMPDGLVIPLSRRRFGGGAAAMDQTPVLSLMGF